MRQEKVILLPKGAKPTRPQKVTTASAPPKQTSSPAKPQAKPAPKVPSPAERLIKHCSQGRFDGKEDMALAAEFLEHMGIEKAGMDSEEVVMVGKDDSFIRLRKSRFKALQTACVCVLMPEPDQGRMKMKDIHLKAISNLEDRRQALENALNTVLREWDLLERMLGEGISLSLHCQYIQTLLFFQSCEGILQHLMSHHEVGKREGKARLFMRDLFLERMLQAFRGREGEEPMNPASAIEWTQRILKALHVTGIPETVLRNLAYYGHPEEVDPKDQ